MRNIRSLITRMFPQVIDSALAEGFMFCDGCGTALRPEQSFCGCGIYAGGVLALDPMVQDAQRFTMVVLHFSDSLTRQD